eukprot:CAMPEP_0202696002 /NCGR_PEP_ID=MMETSP1385-20130828/9400_1 /ASSEMBLY_ACC=CAM_ASM_000861 /TAXON_ID=933848 /ORGANISM="Elphidium margaritaceum" /LENGTH=338 /DNA_ID=CAMNT_0049352093 /DNA_START=117 /DNA_END=1133 /DNA_ORIENTATION=-
MELADRERLHTEKVDRELAAIRFDKLAPYRATEWETLPSNNYNKFQSGSERVPFVKPLSEPYPDGPFMETRPEPLLVWNDFQERYELRDKRIISEKTKRTLLSMHRREPLKWSKYALCKAMGMSEDTVDFIFWEHEMRSKYKIPYDLDSIKLLEAYCGTSDVVESKLYSMMAYSEVTGDPFFTSGKMSKASPLIVHEDELDEHLYSWQKRQRYRPKLGKDQYEIIPEDGAGSGKQIESEREMPTDGRRSYLIVDVDDDRVGTLHGMPSNVRVRENNGKMRWSTLDELNYCREKAYPKHGMCPHNRLRGRNRKMHKKFKRNFPRRPYIDRQYFEAHWNT